MLDTRKTLVHFLVPPTPGEKKTPDRIFGCNYAFFFQHNVFMLYCATFLREQGFEVKITDCPMENLSLEDAVGKDDPANTLYCFYTVFLARDVDLRTARWLQERSGGRARTIFLGTDPTHTPERYLERPGAVVVRGEPEETLLDLCRALAPAADEAARDLSAVPGISYNDGHGVVHNPTRGPTKDIDQFPIPDRTLLKNPHGYTNAKFKALPVTTMIMSRGCSFKCYYCVPNSQSFMREIEFGKTAVREDKKPVVTKRDLDDIERELQEIVRLGYKGVFILDDQFIWGRRRTLDLLARMGKYPLEYSLLCRPDLLTPEIAQAMAAAGVKHVDLGLESFVQEILDDIQKDMDLPMAVEGIHHLKAAGIEPEINVLFGASPLETEDTMAYTTERVEALGVEIIHVKACSPFPGTRFNKKAKAEGWMVTPDFVPIDPARDALISYPHLPREKLVQHVRDFYKRHYFAPSYLFKQLTRVRSPLELAVKARTARTMWRNIMAS
jgi:anaerobic magnesium-protoporphyrin IX monomethyl ester cyclase